MNNLINSNIKTIHKSKSQLQDQSRPPRDIAEIPRILQLRSLERDQSRIFSIEPPRYNT
jgi:hypothetical protein